MLKSLLTRVGGENIRIDFVGGGTTLVSGKKADNVLNIMEALLAVDFTKKYAERNSIFGLSPEVYEGVSRLIFDKAEIVGQDEAIRVIGDLPRIHCVRYVQDGVTRSFIISDTSIEKEGILRIDHDLTESINGIINIADCLRLESLVNGVIGYEFAKFNGSRFILGYSETEWSKEGVMVVFSLLSECILTPMGYTCILLLPRIPCMSDEQFEKLCRSLEKTKRHMLTVVGLNNGVLSLSSKQM